MMVLGLETWEPLEMGNRKGLEEVKQLWEETEMGIQRL